MSFEHRVTRLAGVTPRPYRPMSGLPTRHSFRRPFERRFPRTEARSFPVTLDGRRSSPRDPYRGPEASSATSLDPLTGKPFPCGQHFGPFIVELLTAGISPDAEPCHRSGSSLSPGGSSLRRPRCRPSQSQPRGWDLKQAEPASHPLWYMTAFPGSHEPEEGLSASPLSQPQGWDRSTGITPKSGLPPLPYNGTGEPTSGLLR